jgi:hypothetical protein
MWGSLVKAAASVAMLGVLVDHAKAESSLNDVLRAYDSPQAAAAQRLTISSNLAAIELGLGWANTALRAQKIQKGFYCPPDKLEITPPELVGILRGALEAEPRLGDQPIGFALLTALQRAFPCNLALGPAREKATSRSKRAALRARTTIRKSAARKIAARDLSTRRGSPADDRFAGPETPFSPPAPISPSRDGANLFRVSPISGTP